PRDRKAVSADPRWLTARSRRDRRTTRTAQRPALEPNHAQAGCQEPQTRWHGHRGNTIVLGRNSELSIELCEIELKAGPKTGIYDPGAVETRGAAGKQEKEVLTRGRREAVDEVQLDCAAGKLREAGHEQFIQIVNSGNLDVEQAAAEVQVAVDG